MIKNFSWKHEGMIGRPNYRWENIKMDPKEIGSEDVNWIHLAQDRDQWWGLVNEVMTIKGTEYLNQLSDY
jgi:hypothetical protein